MIVCINCSTETKSKMDMMLAQKNYRDYSELISVAVDNLCVLEHEVAEKGALVIREIPLPPPAIAAPPSVQSARPPRSAPYAEPLPQKYVLGPAVLQPACIPQLFLSNDLDAFRAPIAKMPVANQANDSFTLDRWIFGQFNKLLPAKANCRALMHIAANHPQGLLLETIAPQISQAAALLGDYLAEHDSHHQISRDDSLATAFPRSGLDAEKSRSRYANQFVGSVNSQGVLSGMLVDYCLIALAPGAGAHLMPTEPALQFARLTNPVLDACQTDPAQKFSPEEVTFLLEHIRGHVPVEAFAFRTLIQAISDGANTPDLLNEALRAHIPAETNRSLSPSFLTSQRSGALSRMADLGLIARERKGVRVSYTITPEGEAFAQGGNPHEKENVRS